MGKTRILVVITCYLALASFADPPCVIDLNCAECVPDNMPLVSSPEPGNGSAVGGAGQLLVPAGQELALACPGGAFSLYPRLAVLPARCEQGLFRVRHDAQLRHLLDLECQESVFEDVLHAVEECGPPLQGRTYRMRLGRVSRQLAALCVDADRVQTRFALVPAAAAAAPDTAAGRAAPLSLLGNFNHMFDAKTRSDATKLYSDEARLNARLRRVLRPAGVSLAGQTLTPEALLDGEYFGQQEARAARLVSNTVPVWASVARANLRHLQRDVATRRRAGDGAVSVAAGARGVVSPRGGPALYLRAGRFPVPRYIWTVVADARAGRALALVLLNDPFVSVSEIREAVFCESACGRAGWLHELRRNRNYETPLYGLVFCCDVHEFAAVVPEMPKHMLKNITVGNDGMLLD